MNYKSIILGVVCGLVLGYLLYNIGLRQGIAAYHKQCYLIGGMAVDKDGKVVKCEKAGDIPLLEIKGYKIAPSLFE